MPHKTPRSNKDTISSNGLDILLAISELAPTTDETENPFSMAAIAVKKSEATPTTIEAKLKKGGNLISQVIIREELQVLDLYGYISEDTGSSKGKASKLTYKITNLGLQKLQESQPFAMKPSAYPPP